MATDPKLNNLLAAPARIGREQSRRAARASDMPLFRNSDPPSSRRAARINAVKINSDKGRVLAAIRATPGLSSLDLAKRHGLERFMVARRLPDLRRAGLVCWHTLDGREWHSKADGNPQVNDQWHTRWFAVDRG